MKNNKFQLCESGIAGYGVRLDNVAGIWAVVDYFPHSGKLEIVPLDKEQEKALFTGSDYYRYIHESEFWMLIDGTVDLLN